jgi:hypothetical protein
VELLFPFELCLPVCGTYGIFVVHQSCGGGSGGSGGGVVGSVTVTLVGLVPALGLCRPRFLGT